DAPMAVADSYNTDEDTPLVVSAPGVLANDTDVENDVLTAILVLGPAHGNLTLNADGSFSYTPDANYNGPDSFTYKANDGQADSNMATVSLTVNPVNDAPVAVGNSYSTDEDTPLVVPAPGVLANDTDVENDVLTAILVLGPAHGGLTLNADGSFSYTPDANYNGPDSFTYKANDGEADSNVATVSLTVNPVNDAPMAVADSYNTDEDTPLVVSAPGVLANDTDVENDALTAILVLGPAHGGLTLNADGSFSYTPDANYNGPDSFTYKANDGEADSNVATVSLTVNPVNDAPAIVSATVTPVVNENGTVTLVVSFTDPDTADPHSVTVTWGEGLPVGFNLAAGVTTFTLMHQYLDDNPTGTASDVYSIGVQVTDSGEASDSVSLNTTVSNVSPVVTAGAATAIDEGTLFSRTGSFSDVGTLDVWTATIDYGDGSGAQTLQLNPDHSFSLSHVYADNGVYTATVRVADDDSGVGMATVVVTVRNVAPAVSLSSVSQSVQYSDPVTPVTITATDVPADALSVTSSFNFNGGAFSAGLPQGLSIAGLTANSWILSGKMGVAPGAYIVRVNVADDDGASTTASITIVVSQEDARVSYIGPMLVATPSISNSVATIELRAVIQDITAVLPLIDPDGGVITNATVTFVNRDTGATIAANIPVTLLQASDSLVGIATFNWVVNLGNADAQSFTIGFVVGNYYTRNDSSDDALVTVTRPLEYMVTGGGYLINEDSAGVYAGADGLRTNFGFNVKFNKQLSALQGHANVIIRQNGIVYQIKANAMQSLAVDPVAHTATFVSKANLQDITDPAKTISLGGNLTLIVTLTDPGEPGFSDTIGITLWKGTQLLLSSNWTGAQTIEQLLGGGNLVIHTGGHLEAGAESPAAAQTIETVTYASLESVVQKARSVWTDSGLSDAQARVLNEARFVIADLEGATLGISLGDTVWIDRDGAGAGWLVDGQPEYNARAFDLLTVVIHELGHAMGFDHADEADNVMSPTLAPSVRRQPLTALPGYQPSIAKPFGPDVFEPLVQGPLRRFSAEGEDGYFAPMDYLAGFGSVDDKVENPSDLRTRVKARALRRVFLYGRSPRTIQ
ncbi:MAG TPA: Ig-like domain-containing protein, partial [Terriglobia bacterium]|nr:Ig-like domain-containing protein [Terriglobia bacterium]